MFKAEHSVSERTVAQPSTVCNNTALQAHRAVSWMPLHQPYWAHALQHSSNESSATSNVAISNSCNAPSQLAKMDHKDD